MTLGLHSGRLALAEHHLAWAREFQHERARIEAALGPHLTAIEHIGSTAIPGLPAKPILDLQLGVLNFEQACVCIAPLQSLGYEYRGEYGIARRHYFVKGDPRTHHAHMLEVSSENWAKALAFRDALLARPDLVQIYRDAKIAMIAAGDRAAYQDAKGPVIERILEMFGSDPG